MVEETETTLNCTIQIFQGVEVVYSKPPDNWVQLEVAYYKALEPGEDNFPGSFK